MAKLRSLLNRMCQGYTDLHYFCNMVPYLPIPVRKAIMTICRVQQSPWSNRRVHKAISDALPFRFIVTIRSVSQEKSFLNDVLPIVLDYLHDPVVLGFISMVIRVVKLEDDTSAYLELQSTIDKELDCALGNDRPMRLDYKCLFAADPGSREIPLLPNTFPRPALAAEYHRAITDWKARMSKTVLYPKYERIKSTGEVTASRYRRAMDINPGSRVPVTTLDLERLYHSRGWQIGGPCEVRWAWKYNDLKPRVYYAQGGDAYFSSRYIRSLANSFCDLFPVSARQTRYSVTRLNPLDHQSTLIVYDYSSFTSELTELKYFMQELADFCRDTTVTCLDTFVGLVQHNLGDLLEAYNSEINVLPEMDLTRILQVQEGRYIESHKKSGMLGVYGNIVWSTALHGILLSFLTGSSEQASVVGDDAAGILLDKEWSIRSILEALRSLGQVHPDKLEHWGPEPDASDTHGWQFLKRPLDRIANSAFVGILVDFPLAIYGATTEEDLHTVDAGSKLDRIKAIVMQCCRLLDRLHQYESRLSEESISFALQVIRILFESVELPVTGALPPFHHPKVKEPIRLLMPILARESVSRPWIDVVTEEFSGRPFTLKDSSWSTVTPDRYRFVGQTTRGTQSPLMTIAEDLGWIEKEQRWIQYVLDDTTSGLLRHWVEGNLDAAYEYTYTCEPHKWWTDAFSAQV